MGPKPNVALLFHPKKGAKKDTPPTSPPKKPSAPRPKPIPNDDEEELKLPDAPFQEFKVMSSALNGWKYDVMKFDSRKPVDLTSWPAPIKLNRKEMRRDDASGTQVAVGPMLGLDGKPVVGPDGKFVMVDADGKPIHAESAKDPKDKGPAVNGKKKFQKKTRQVYVVPEEVRQLRREERYPWVMEDATQAETWVGQLEDTSKSGTHAFFMPAANDIFKFVPAHRWYKFQKKLKHADLPTDTLTMESAYTNNQKRDPQQWLYNRNGKGPSSETAAMFKAESEGRALAGSSSLVHSSGQSLGPNGRKLKTVDSGMSNLFGEGDDEDGDAKRRREKEYGGDGDMDEIVFEEDFADDDEKVDLEAEDEETKDIEERLKKEYKSANKQRDGHIDESDDEDMPGMSKQAKAMQKLIRNREGNDAYDSDDEKNPYASSEEEEEEEAPPEPVVLQPPVPPQPPADSRGGSQAPGPQAPIPPARPQAGGSKVGSRATSPVASPGLGGHSVVAKRATSPKAHKQKSNGASRGNSPLASRATSPVTNSRATSPVAGGAAGPTVNGSQKKRKATDEYAAGSPSPTSPNGAPPKAKKRKAHNGGVVPVGELEDKMVIEWLRNTPNATTRDCIQHFQPYLTDEAKKSKFTALIKEVAQLKGGVVVLRSAYSGT